MDKVRIYAPNLNKLFEAFDCYYNARIVSKEETNNYLYALLSLNILKEGLFQYELCEGWEFMLFSGSRRSSQFKQQILKRSEVNKIINIIGDNGLTVDNILKCSSENYSSETIITFISWMEMLGLLQLKDEKYWNSNEEEDDYGEIHSEYPTLEDDISIKEDKFSIFEYLRRLSKGNINLSPDFQRHEVWKVGQKSKFIESVLMGLPLPPIYLKKDTDTKYIVVDGLQRTSTLRDFASGNLQLSGLEPEGVNILNNATFSTLNDVKDGLQARFEDRQIQVYVMEPSVPMSVVYDVFNRINTGGTQLSRQEIRNCIFQGKSTNLIKSISDDEVFKKSIDCGILPLRMKDREAVLRCIAFVVMNYELDYDGSMDKFLEKAMTRLNKMSDLDIETIKQKTLDVFERTYKIFSRENFRIPTDYTRGRINIAVMETVFHCFYGNVNTYGIETQIRQAFYNLVDSDDYLNSVRWSTGSISQVKTRFRMAHNLFDNLLHK